MTIAWLPTRHKPTICSHQIFQGLKKERKSEWLIKFTTLQSVYLLEIQIRFSRSTLQNLKLTVPLAIHIRGPKFKAKENKTTNLKAKNNRTPTIFNCIIIGHSSNKMPDVTYISAGHVCDGC